MEDRFATLMYTHSHAEVYDDGNRSLGKGCHLALNELERFRFLVSDLQPEVMGKHNSDRTRLIFRPLDFQFREVACVRCLTRTGLTTDVCTGRGAKSGWGQGQGMGSTRQQGQRMGVGGSSLPQELLGKSCSLNARALGSAVDEVGGIIIVPKT